MTGKVLEAALDEYSLRVACDSCRARVGTSCLTIRSKVPTHPHASRRLAARATFFCKRGRGWALKKGVES